MPYAVTLRLDAAAAAPVEAMWRALADGGLHNDSLTLGYAPHVTLSIHPDGIDASHLLQAVRRCAAGWEAIPVHIAGFGVFTAPTRVLYLAPVVTSPLLLRQQDLAEALSGLPGDPHYQPGAWVPHITLAKGGLASGPEWMGRALDRLAPLWATLRSGLADRIDIVHFRPVTVLQSVAIGSRLAGPAPSV